MAVFMKIIRFLGRESWANQRGLAKTVKIGQNRSKWSKLAKTAKISNKVRNDSFDQNVLTSVMSKGRMTEMHFLVKTALFVKTQHRGLSQSHHRGLSPPHHRGLSQKHRLWAKTPSVGLKHRLWAKTPSVA